MKERIENIAEHYTIDELEKLKVLLAKIEKSKKKVLESSINVYKFSQEYKKYIKITFSSTYIKSVVLSLKHLSEFFGEDKLIVDLSVKDIEELKYYLMNRAPKGFTVYMRTLKAAFNIANEWGYITSNPFQKVKFKKGQNKKPIFISRDDLQLVIEMTQSEQMKNIFLFAFNTGCRLSEITNLRWNNIDLDNLTITIGDELFTTKNEKQRTIPISNELIKILTKIKKTKTMTNHYVFGKTKGFPYRSEYVSRNFKKASREAKLNEEVHFHTLRHSFASNLAIRGVPIIVIKELLGHSSIVTTEIYSHTNLASLQVAIEQLDIS